MYPHTKFECSRSYNIKDLLHTRFYTTEVKVTVPGRGAHSVMCLTTDMYLTADPGVTSLIPAWSHTFMVIDHEIYLLWSFFPLPLIHLRSVVVSYKRKCVHEVLVNCSFKLSQEKVWLGELTVPT